MYYKDLQYDYECGIELFTRCNYHCEYCSGPRVRKEVRRGRTVEDIEKVIGFFNSPGKTWLIGMSGGEPSIHPRFYSLIDGLKSRHYFYLFTNLSFDVHRFCRHLPAERVQYIKASLHPEGNEEEFLDRFAVLYEGNYNPILTMVSAPGEFERIVRIAGICVERGWPFNLSVMEGPYRNRNYPNDFSKEEAVFIQSYTDEPGNLLRLFNGSPGGLNTYGLRCMAGRKSFVLDMESGEIMTCESVKASLGNVYRGVFKPGERDIDCPAINGCVGYVRNIHIPNAYIEFFERVGNSWRVKDVKAAGSFPENLYCIIRPDATRSTNIIVKALGLIRDTVERTETLFWGAGTYGSKVLYYLRESFGEEAVSKVVGFVDSCPERWGKRQLDIPIFSPSDPIVRNAQQIIITSYAYEEEILGKAEEMGLGEKVIPLHGGILKALEVSAGLF